MAFAACNCCRTAQQQHPRHTAAALSKLLRWTDNCFESHWILGGNMYDCTLTIVITMLWYECTLQRKYNTFVTLIVTVEDMVLWSDTSYIRCIPCDCQLWKNTCKTRGVPVWQKLTKAGMTIHISATHSKAPMILDKDPCHGHQHS